MAYFLSNNSVLSAYNELILLDVDNSSILHIFFILKVCGFSRDAFLPVSEIAARGYAPAHSLSSLFSHCEVHPVKYDFISPFSMGQWESQAPSEPLKKWVGGRIKNNVIGGATTWRKIVDDDPDEGSFRFKYNYLEELIALTLKNQKINIFALSLWVYRFTSFPKKMSLIQLSKLFKSDFNISDLEADLLFSNSASGIQVVYSNHMHDPSLVRQKIGPPKNHDETWIFSEAEEINDGDSRLIREENLTKLLTRQVNMNGLIHEILDRNGQVILAGPPGTSKSFYANKIASEFFDPENVISIQFHPKYSYQDFIGGYVVKGADVVFSDGVLYKLVQKAKSSPDSNFLLIIDEINRANVGQVFGETIQCLDRGYEIKLLRDQELEGFSLPENLKIIASMNTSDRSLGAMDFAIRRRFPTVYCPASPDLVTEFCISESELALGDFLRNLNNRLFCVLKNKELVIGHAFFLDKSLREGKKYQWSNHDLEMLFNYQILPMVEDFTKGNVSQLSEIFGENLLKRLQGEDFISAIETFIINES